MIQNLAVIESLSLSLRQGLTALTGETGAGKSILIDAINLVLGERATKDLVRTGEEKARVEAVFTDLPSTVQKKLQEYGYDIEDGTLLLTREITADGKSTARLMGRPATAAIVRELAPDLLNIHGQHDNQLLLNAKQHLRILDQYGGAEAELAAYQDAYRQFVALKKAYLENQMDEQQKVRRMELLEYEIEEISRTRDVLDKEEELLQQSARLRASEKLRHALDKAYIALYGVDGEGGGYDAISSAALALKPVLGIDPELDVLTERLENLRAETEDLAQQTQRLGSSVEYDEELLVTVENYLEEIKTVKRKYGGTVEAVIEHFEKAQEELQTILLSDQRRAELEEQINTAKKQVVSLGQQLSEVRETAAGKFSEQMQQELLFLDMPNVSLSVHREKGKYGSFGCDVVEFLFSTNRGEEPRPLHKIASGGELSRIMLALRCVLAEKEAVGTLIFDEIDAGVSGSSAQKIGRKLLEAANSRQVLCVTHSAQIAALADHNLLIRKETRQDRTCTSVLELDHTAKVREVARIMATDSITELMLQNAEAMVNEKKLDK